MIVPPSSAHTPRADVIGNNIGVISELLIADAALAILRHDFSIEQFAHLPV